MHVVRKDDSQEKPATAPIFVGDVRSRPLVTAEVSPAVTVTLVRFIAGGRNRRHTHTADQILYITEGHGIVADDATENQVTAGDIVHVAAGTVHWHGAQPGKDMAHLSILPPSKTDVVE